MRAPVRLELRGVLGELDPSECQERARALDVHPVVVELLVARGVMDEAAQRRMLHPRLSDLRPPRGMAGFEAAIDRLMVARERGHRVGVYGDYDVDGITTATILTTFLESLGLQVVPRVAHREGGYGFHVGAARALLEAGVDLVLTGDCGTSDHEALAWLAERGVETIVIDHHQVPETMPPAAALINPWQPGDDFPFKGLCSAGVAFYLAAALRTRVKQVEPSAQLPDPRAWLDLVALGTVCDMVPLRDENRILVHHGLRELDARRRPGLRALLERARVKAKTQLDEGHIGFQLGPRINAPGRLESAEPSLSLLRARSATEAAALAAQVESLNEQRRSLQAQVVAEAEALLAADPRLDGRAGIVVAGQGWPAGVVGIAAAGIVGRHGRPTLVVAIDPETGEARGSARSCGGVDVRAALTSCGELLDRYGGHQAAAGVSLPATNLPALVEAFDAAVAAQIGRAGAPEDVVVHDGELDLARLDHAFVEAVGRAGPYGQGFERPRFVVLDVEVGSTRKIKEEHLAMRLRSGGAEVEAVAWRQGDVPVERGDRISCLVEPEFNDWGGRRKVQLVVERIWS